MIWNGLIKKGLWNLGIKNVIGKGLFKKVIWENGIKKRPKTVAKIGLWTGAAIAITPVPAGAMFLGWQGLKGLNKLRKNRKAKKLQLSTA